MRSGRASSTVKKERAALNTFLRWLVEFEHISALQARQALAVKLPRAEQAGREAPKALSSAQYDDLLRAAKAAIADDPLAGARDLAIVLVLGDAGLRCEELAGLQRARTSSPRARARSCARSRSVTARATAAAPSSSASARRARSCAGSASAPRVLGAPARDAALFITLGRRRADGSTRASGGAAGSRRSPR